MVLKDEHLVELLPLLVIENENFSIKYRVLSNFVKTTTIYINYLSSIFMYEKVPALSEYVFS
jgi:hypothetical protein